MPRLPRATRPPYPSPYARPAQGNGWMTKYQQDKVETEWEMIEYYWENTKWFWSQIEYAMGQIEWNRRQIETDMLMIQFYQKSMSSLSTERQQRFLDENREIERVHEQLIDLEKHPAWVSMRNIFRPTNE